MPEAEPQPKVCGYVYCFLLYLISTIFVWFGYQNNAWLVVRNEKTELQRGLNDDCYREFSPESIQCYKWSTVHNPFPPPFDNVIEPGALLKIAMWTARILRFVPVFWFILSLACCLNVNVEKLSKTRRLALYHVFGVGAILFFILSIFMIISLFSGSLLEEIPEGNDYSLGTGFYLFVVGGFIPYALGTYFFYQSEFHEILQRRLGRHQALANDYPLSGQA